MKLSERLNLGLVLIFIIVLMSFKTNKNEEKDNARFIDPFICTANDHGQTDPAAGVPFGMIRPCPDTSPLGHSGYDYTAKKIIGFSNTRFSGVGCKGAGGNIRILPFIGKDKKTSFCKNTEMAKPGYYSVVLKSGIKAELTSTAKVAFYRYTFPQSSKSGLSVDLASSFAEHVSEDHTINEQGILSGRIESFNVCQEGKNAFYYALLVDKADVRLNSNDSKLEYRFTTEENEVVPVYCALSVVSVGRAITNLKEDMKLTFGQARGKAYEEWNNLTNVVEVETEDESLKRLFYTHLYHVAQSPFLISEDDGTYRGSDGEIGRNQEFSYYHGWSVWDTFRSKLPLLSLLYPQKYTQMLSSMVEMYHQGKPQWSTDTEPFLTVRTEHSIIVVLEAYRKGLLNFPLDELYPYLQKEAEGLSFQSPDEILESSFDLWALSEIAKEVGCDADHEEYLTTAMNYQDTWKDKFMIMTNKSDIMHGDGLYEGTLWQYRWFVPFDIEGIQQLLGGKEIFEQQLDYFFDNDFFNIGNQPDIQVPYLYAYTRSPWKTQRVVNHLLSEPSINWYGTHKKRRRPEIRRIFKDSPDGYISEMDDDAGTMSAWYVWSAMGLYPVFPGSTDMVISAPLFDLITINGPNRKLIIETKRASDKAFYIQKVVVDGVRWDSCFIDFMRLSEGGHIVIELGEQPNLGWGTLN